MTTAQTTATQPHSLGASLNDQVEDLHRQLACDMVYQRLLHAVHDEQALEGSTYADDVMAAGMLRARAREQGSPVQREKLASIIKALNQVLCYHGLDRMTRRNLLAGEVVPEAGKQAEQQLAAE